KCFVENIYIWLRMSNSTPKISLKMYKHFSNIVKVRTFRFCCVFLMEGIKAKLDPISSNHNQTPLHYVALVDNCASTSHLQAEAHSTALFQTVSSSFNSNVLMNN